MKKICYIKQKLNCWKMRTLFLNRKREHGVGVSNIQLELVSSNKMVKAELWDSITSKNIKDVKVCWTPEIKEDADYAHWNWEEKISNKNNPNYMKFSIIRNYMTQGLMILKIGEMSKSNPTNKLVYVDYIQVAPWNEASYRRRKYSPVGTILFDVAIDVSKNVGYNGRLGLYSLPSSVPFYLRRGMKIVPGHRNNGMDYYELP